MDIKKAILDDLSEVKKNLLLLLSANSNEPINGKLWYQKELYLLSRNNKELEEEAGFEPYFWGAHSELADTEMEELVQLGVVKKIGSKYMLTDIGRDISNSILQKSSQNEKELINDVKDFMNSLTKDELLLFVYISYPEMCEDAVELKNLIPKRKDIALGLYRKGRISVGKAAELAGVSAGHMIKELQNRGVYRVEEK